MKIMQKVHDAPMAGHYGEKIIREFLGKTFYWLEMREDIEHYVYMYVKCQSTKSVHYKKFKLYKPLPIPSSSFKNVSIDFMTCLPKWEGMDAIFVVVDKFSKLPKFTPTQTNATVTRMAKLFFNMWIQHNGMLTVIVSDQDVKFTL
jgi:hypothetical protein